MKQWLVSYIGEDDDGSEELITAKVFAHDMYDAAMQVRVEFGGRVKHVNLCRFND